MRLLRRQAGYGNPISYGTIVFPMTDLRALADEVRDFYLRSHRVVDGMMKAGGASLVRSKLLAFIAHAGPVRSADIAASFGYSPRTVTEAIDALERDGLAARTADADDRRAKRISITPAGEAARAAAEPARQRFLEQVFGPLSEEERAALSAILRKMICRLESLERQ